MPELVRQHVRLGGIAAWLEGEDPRSDPEPPSTPLEVEVSLPQEWHSQPMAIDPDGSLRPID